MGLGGSRWILVGLSRSRWVSVGLGGCRRIEVNLGGARWADSVPRIFPCISLSLITAAVGVGVSRPNVGRRRMDSASPQMVVSNPSQIQALAAKDTEQLNLIPFEAIL